MLAPVFYLFVSSAACSQKEPISSAEVVSKFVASLNNKDMETFSRLSATPLWVRQQDWASAKDGAGFTLGQANDISLTDVASIKKYFSDPVKKIAVERETPTVHHYLYCRMS